MVSGGIEVGSDASVVIYTDGACLGNPGPGGYGAVLINGAYRKELSGGFRQTTNNRMEIMGAVVALQTLKRRCAVILYSDSQYLVNAIEKGWAQRWRDNGWRRNRQTPARNADLWGLLLELCAGHSVKFEWIRGHAGNKENERVDQLAVGAANRDSLPADDGYENCA